MKRISSITAFILVCFVLSAAAHPGHSLGEHGPLHIVTSPYHLAVLAFAGSTFLIASRFVHRRLSRYLLRGAGLAAFLTVAIIWGIR